MVVLLLLLKVFLQLLLKMLPGVNATQRCDSAVSGRELCCVSQPCRTGGRLGASCLISGWQ